MVFFLVSLGRGGLSLYIILAFMISLSLLVLMSLALVFGTALILVVLDNARNLREMRRDIKSRS